LRGRQRADRRRVERIQLGGALDRELRDAAAAIAIENAR